VQIFLIVNFCRFLLKIFIDADSFKKNFVDADSFKKVLPIPSKKFFRCRFLLKIFADAVSFKKILSMPIPLKIFCRCRLKSPKSADSCRLIGPSLIMIVKTSQRKFL
jgi:hypothetical protein